MAASLTSRLRIFPVSPVEDAADPDDRLFHREAFRKLPRGEHLDAFSPEWFARIQAYRYDRQGYWLPRMLEFTKHRGETVLGLGEGLGTDWLQFARHGADVITVSPSQEQLELTRAQFDAGGQGARFLHGPVHALPVAAGTVDVVCVNGLLHELDEPCRVVDEVYRVLRPGGKVIAVAPAKYNATYWGQAFFPWRRWLRSGRPTPAAVTASSLKHLFVDFAQPRVSKRHLRRGELPPLWRWLPLTVLERAIGNLLVLKAFKPLSAAAAERRAA